MKVYLSQMLLSFYLLSALAPQVLEEFAKLPALVTHYQIHRSEVPGTTFSQFISEHYGKGYASHCKQHDHSKLPGKAKHNDSCIHLFNSIGEATVYQLVVAVQSYNWEEPQNSTVFGQDQNLVSTYLSCIWQPPRA
ncbi:hypothetical protein [Haliscomenobacter hydrossis]|nr:hypothetical protein [Haliscomenobacter hydrossis]